MSPRRFAVVGSPIAHSLSPLLHRTAYEVLGIEDAVYERFEVPAGDLARFLGTGAGRDLLGLSVTMPGKPEAFALAASTDRTAAELGIANTLVREADGSWRAENHDVHGIVAALRAHGARTPRSAGVLGSGATALSAVAALVELGTSTLRLSARSEAKLAPMVAFAAARGTAVHCIPWERHHEVLEAEVVVSALALDGALAVARAWAVREVLPAPAVFLDVLYDPWPAPLATVVGRAGGEVADGLEMLVHQADMQLRSMLGVSAAPVEAMLAAAGRALGRGA